MQDQPLTALRRVHSRAGDHPPAFSLSCPPVPGWHHLLRTNISRPRLAPVWGPQPPAV